MSKRNSVFFHLFKIDIYIRVFIRLRIVMCCTSFMGPMQLLKHDLIFVNFTSQKCFILSYQKRNQLDGLIFLRVNFRLL